MNTGVVAMRYARALLEYAKANGKQEQVYAEAKTLSHNFFELPALRHALDNPVLSADKKIALLVNAAGGESVVSNEMKRFFDLVLKKHREKFLQFITWSYIDLYLEDQNILVGKLTTAVPSEKLVRYLTTLVSRRTKGKVEVEQKIDPKLIGGCIIEMAGIRLDASVKNQLDRVKQQFIARNRRIV